MNSKSSFWPFLEIRLGPIREPVWKLALGKEFPHVRRYLKPAPDLATAVSCDHSRATGCEYRIVEHPDGSFVGICDTGRCPRHEFTRAELIRYAIQDRRLLEEGGRLLGLPLAPVELAPPGISLFIGTLPSASAFAIRSSEVSLLYTRQSNRTDLLRLVEKQVVAGRAPFILLTPTLRHLTPETNALLQAHGCCTLALDGGLVPGPRGLTATDAFLARWRALCASYSESPEHRTSAVPSDPVPEYGLICEGATWRVHFRGDTFTVGHSVALDQLAHLLRHWKHAFNPIEVRQLVDPRELGEPAPDGETRETEASAEAASIDSMLRIKRRLQQLNQDEAENAGHEIALAEIAEERDQLEQELLRITTPDGRVRREGGTMDKARKAVSNNLARLRNRIAKENPRCARHIWRGLTLGFSMTYTPDFGEEWTVRIRSPKRKK